MRDFSSSAVGVANAHAGKDVENRSERSASQFKTAIGEHIFIHASKTMTDDEYAFAAQLMAKIGEGPSRLI